MFVRAQTKQRLRIARIVPRYTQRRVAHRTGQVLFAARPILWQIALRRVDTILRDGSAFRIIR